MATLKNFLRADSGVSEVIGFVTIVGILVLSFSIIAIAGYPMLKNAQNAKYIENTRQSFILMADDINKIVLGDAPSRSVEIKMYGGRLGIVENGNIRVSAVGYNLTSATPEEIPLIDQKLMGIESSIEDVIIAYQDTGVWAKYPEGSALNIYRPLIINDSNGLVMPIVQINGMSSIAGAGMSRVQVKGTPIITSYNNLSYVNVTITGDYAKGWKSYFEEKLKWKCTGDTDISCISDSTNYNVYILNVRLDTDIE